MILKNSNSKLTLALVVLILALVICNISKLYNNLVNNNIISQDNFNNTGNNIEDKLTDTRLNEIIYGMNPNCLSPGREKQYCPNEHPNIPCSKLNCSSSSNRLTDEMKRDIYMYVYLTGLLESVDIWNKDSDKTWYSTK